MPAHALWHYAPWKINRKDTPNPWHVFDVQFPAVSLNGQMLLWNAAWKHRSSLYPMTTAARRRFAAELEGYETSKGTIRLFLEKPVPVALVRRLVKARIAELRSKKSKA